MNTVFGKNLTFVAWAALSLLLAGEGAAEDPYEEAWARQLGTSEFDDWGLGVAVDAMGNAFISGGTNGSLGPGGVGSSPGKGDPFLVKYDTAGNLLWTQQLGTSGEEIGRGVAVDAVGNAFISGETNGSLGGPHAGKDDAFLLKYSAEGNLLWTQQLGTSDSDYSEGIAVDAVGSAFVTGFTGGSLGGPSAGDYDAFLAKYSAAGNLLWTQQLGTSALDVASGVAVDAAGSAFITGYTKGSLGGPNAGGNDAFLAKYSAAGNLLWTQQLGTSEGDRARSVAVDAVGSAFVIGATSGSLGGPNAGENDAFLAKYSAEGNLLWTQQLGTSKEEAGYGVAVDAVGSAFVSGVTLGSLGGPNAGGNDAFLAKYSAEGNLLWTQQLGTIASDYGEDVAVDAVGSAFITGTTRGSLGGPHAGERDAFLAKFEFVPSSIPVIPGDYNQDGVVDAADYTMWADNRGSTFDLGGNGDETGGSGGVVDVADYSLWKASFGNTAAGSATGAVPEPTSLLVTLVGMLALALFNRRR